MVEGYGVDSRLTALLNKLTFVVIPVLNVDGYVYSWTNVSQTIFFVLLLISIIFIVYVCLCLKNKFMKSNSKAGEKY